MSWLLRCAYFREFSIWGSELYLRKHVYQQYKVNIPVYNFKKEGLIINMWFNFGRQKYLVNTSNWVIGQNLVNLFGIMISAPCNANKVLSIWQYMGKFLLNFQNCNYLMTPIMYMTNMVWFWIVVPNMVWFWIVVPKMNIENWAQNIYKSEFVITVGYWRFSHMVKTI